MNEKKFTLRDMAITQNREKLSHNESADVAERFMLVIGSENAGKSNLINQMLQMDKGCSKPASSTYLLEYKYGRQAGMTSLFWKIRKVFKESKKKSSQFFKDEGRVQTEVGAGNVCHIWELGSGTAFVSLLPAIVKSRKPTSVVLVLDLTSSELIAKTAETLLDSLRSFLTKSSENEDTPKNEFIQDETHWGPFPISLIIIGGKYDLFQNFESAKKRIICQYLRCLAHILQADLFFYSQNDSKLMKNVREALLEYAFGIPVNKNNIVTDYNSPLYIPTDHDSFSNMESSPVGSIDNSLRKYKNNLLAHFSQQQSNPLKPMPDDPSKDTNFLEHVIDNLCVQKEEELKRIQEENRRKAAAIESIKMTKMLQN